MRDGLTFVSEVTLPCVKKFIPRTCLDSLVQKKKESGKEKKSEASTDLSATAAMLARERVALSFSVLYFIFFSREKKKTFALSLSQETK